MVISQQRALANTPRMIQPPVIGECAGILSQKSIRIGVIGIGKIGLRASQDQKLRSDCDAQLAGDESCAAEAFLLWDKTHVNGELVRIEGLHIRRMAERALFLKPYADIAK